MADVSRTEPSTPKKRRETREKGEVARSMEINAGVNLFTGLAAACVLSGLMFTQARAFFTRAFMALGQAAPLAEAGLQEWLSDALLSTVRLMLPVMLAIAVATVASNYLQVGFKVATQAIEPKWNKLNPIDGFKRIFSLRSWTELAKSAIKITVVGGLVYWTLKARLPRLITALPGPLAPNLVEAGQVLWEIIWKLGIFFLGVGALDWFWQRYEFDKKLRMTKQEVRDEYRQTEGDGQIKSRRRSWHRRLVSSRMAAEVARADVVTTNPTHYAVAIKYDAKRMRAPRVVAKGERLWAKLIVAIARKHRVPVMENKPLTRALFHNVEIGQDIPPMLYRAVAEVLATLYKLRARRRSQP